MVVKVDLENLPDRIVGLPIMPGTYSDIRAIDDRVFYIRRTSADDGDDDDDGGGAGGKGHLCSFSLEDRKETVIGELNEFQITNDGKKMLVKIKKDYAIIDLPKDKIETKDHDLKVSDLDMSLDRHAEWNQIYFEAWRQMRDFFTRPT